ncbi:MAG: cobalamin biosynthesis protein [Nitrospirae bacterium]|nr:cobalamin biosynthesis protein [Nitrospirota bacterium]
MQRKLWIALTVMAMMVPLGIVLPQIFGAGGAWGEWSSETINQMLGYLPEGMRHYAGLWSAPVGDYSVVAEGANTSVKSFSYIVSAFIGSVIVGLVVYVISIIIQRAAARPDKHAKQ